MYRRARNTAVPLLACCALLLAGGCGDSHTKVSSGTYAGESGKNAPYLSVGPLIYQVQLSRQLNPYDVEDASYLQGLAPLQSTLAPGQEWFGVFIQVFNHGSTSLPAAASPTISDTQGNIYAPVVPNATNQFVYRGGIVPANGRLPVLDSVAAQGATQGALLLYKIHIGSLDNRPLTISIVDPANAAQRASAELDV